MYEFIQQLLMTIIVAVITAFANNYLQNQKIKKEFEKSYKQVQLDIRKMLIQRSHDIYLKFAKTWGQKFINQTPDRKGVIISSQDKKELFEILFEIMYGSHDKEIKVLAYHCIQELNTLSPSFNGLEKLSRMLIDAPIKDFNLSVEKKNNKNCTREE